MRPLLELVRVHLTPTAVADSWAGFFIARSLAQPGDGSVPLDWGRLAALATVSVLAYWGGMVSNDLFDLKKDRRRFPDRPLTSGRTGPGLAAGIAIGLASVAAAVAWWLGILPILGLLYVAILAYNGGGKRLPVVGNLLMGSCRSLNLLLGAAAATADGSQGIWAEPQLLAAASLLGLYIALVTAISILEDRSYDRGKLRLALSGLLAAPLTLAAWGWPYPGAWLNSALFSLHLALGFRMPRDRTEMPPGPHPADLVVRRGLGGIFFVDAGLLLCFDQRWPALVVYGLLAVAWLLKRWWFGR